MQYGRYTLKATIQVSGHAVNQDEDIEKAHEKLIDRFYKDLILFFDSHERKKRLTLDMSISLDVNDVELYLQRGI